MNEPCSPPSALAPLSVHTMTIVFSRIPSSSRRSTTRPRWWSVCDRKPANTSIWRAYRRCSSAGRSAQAFMPSRPRGELGVGAARCPRRPGARTTRSRHTSQPSSKRPRYLSIHSGGAWCGACIAPGREVHEERAMRCGLLLLGDHADRLVGEVLVEVVALLRGARRLHVGVVADEVGSPLVGVAGGEAVVPLEPEPERPAVERPGLVLVPPGRDVPLAESHRVVPGVAQDAGERRRRLGDAAVVAGEPGRAHR